MSEAIFFMLGFILAMAFANGAVAFCMHQLKMAGDKLDAARITYADAGRRIRQSKEVSERTKEIWDQIHEAARETREKR